jgi:two-component system cell cycle sensor histidine kinase/response regulator CckA
MTLLPRWLGWLGWHGESRLVRALLHDPNACVALLDNRAQVLRSGGGWRILPGGRVVDGLPDVAAKSLLRSVTAGQELVLHTRLADAPVTLSLAPVRVGRIAAILRLTDCSRTHELEEALGQAQRLQEVGELAGGIAHDFNNLLTAILGAADDLAARAAKSGSEEDPDLAQIRASAARGAQLVRQLLAFSQRQTLQPRVLVLDEAVERATTLLRRLVGNQCKLVMSLKVPERRVHMDATQLDQVLMNLVINARNAMGDGGTITIGTDRRLVLTQEETAAGTIPPGRYVEISIADSGPGIPPEILSRIFDPFFTTRRDEGGTGLGLSMVQGIVRQSGGHLSVRSMPGEGTCFRILLPRHDQEGADAPALAAPAQAPAPASAAMVTPVAPAGSRDQRCVLLVDDDDAIRRLAKRALSRAGCMVVDADGADQALEAALDSVDCVVSDVSMPGMDGPTLVRKLREARPALPAILISGYADAAQRQALAAEDIAFLPKPFSMAELTRVVLASLVSEETKV